MAFAQDIIQKIEEDIGFKVTRESIFLGIVEEISSEEGQSIVNLAEEETTDEVADNSANS